MSVRRDIYELLSQLPDRNSAQRIAALGEFFDSLPAEQVESVERRMLAFTKAYAIMLETDMKGTLDEFFESVDAIERTLVN